MNNIYVADFETLVPTDKVVDDVTQLNNPEMILSGFSYNKDDIEALKFQKLTPTEELSFSDDIDKLNDTRVWAWGITTIEATKKDEDVIYGNTFSGFIEQMRALNSATVFFHNLSFDGFFLIDKLIRLGYEIVEQFITLPNGKTRKNKINPGEMAVLAADNGNIYTITVNFRGSRGLITFKDSYKLLPLSLENLTKDLKVKHQKLVGEINYETYRPFGHQLTNEEIKYLINDVNGLAEVLHSVESSIPGFLSSMTIGGYAMRHFKETKRGAQFKQFLAPELALDIDQELRKAYRGGWCYVNEKHKGKTIYTQTGNVYDVNSLYPSVMVKHRYPIGDPKHYTANDFNNPEDFINFCNDNSLLYFIKVKTMFKLKEDHLPFIQFTHSRFGSNAFITETEGIEELVLTKVDYELFITHYEVLYLDFIEGWAFNTLDDIFDEYINKFYIMKKNATNPSTRLVAKLLLNNLYGKMAQNPVKQSGVPYIDAKKNTLKFEVVEDISVGGFIPIGAYITSYARAVTINAAQANYENFLYSDTDSIHLKEEAVGIDIDSKELGKWDHEAHFTIGKYVRQKTYAELLSDGTLDIKACGATKEVKANMRKKHVKDGDDWIILDEEWDEAVDFFEYFRVGLKEEGKRMKKRSSGGLYITNRTFSINKE